MVPVSTAGFSISPTTVTFANQALGTTSAADSATLINVGNATLTFSSIQVRLDDALKAWTNTLALAHDEIEREGVYIHFARLKLQADRFPEVHAHLAAVTNELYAVLKNRLSRNLDAEEHKDPRKPTLRQQRWRKRTKSIQL